VVWNDIVAVGELFVADCAISLLLGDLSLQQFPHFAQGIGVLDIPSDDEGLQCVEFRAVVCAYTAFARDRSSELIYESDSIHFGRSFMAFLRCCVFDASGAFFRIGAVAAGTASTEQLNWWLC
jgi:hypothetical protein